MNRFKCGPDAFDIDSNLVQTRSTQEMIRFKFGPDMVDHKTTTTTTTTTTASTASTTTTASSTPAATTTTITGITTIDALPEAGAAARARVP